MSGQGEGQDARGKGIFCIMYNHLENIQWCPGFKSHEQQICPVDVSNQMDQEICTQLL